MSRKPRIFGLTKDGSIIGPDSKILFFSLEKFQSDIVQGDCCFICGSSPNEVEFNDEHVIPDWMLREFKLHKKEISLPNAAGLKYSKYKVPCCVKCNLFLGQSFEIPISKLLKGGYETVYQHIQKRGPWMLYLWLSLVFFKTHLKDRSLRFSLDKRKGTEKIAEIYDWNAMHHIHCVIRSIHTGVPLNRRIIGSFFMLPAKMAKHIEPFDFGDLFFTRTIFLRFNEIAIFVVIDDGCATHTLMKDGPISKISGPLSPIQLREMMARMAYAASLITSKPKFFTTLKDGFPAISVKLPKYVKTAEDDGKRLGSMMYHLCGNELKSCDIPNKEQILENLKSGRLTFTFDEEGNFLSDSMDIVPSGAKSL